MSEVTAVETMNMFRGECYVHASLAVTVDCCGLVSERLPDKCPYALLPSLTVCCHCRWPMALGEVSWTYTDASDVGCVDPDVMSASEWCLSDGFLSVCRSAVHLSTIVKAAVVTYR